MIAAPALARRTDVSSSHEAAARMTGNRAAKELAAVKLALSRHPDSTSAELAYLASDIGETHLAQTVMQWRSTLGRRLSTGEDAGMFEATCPSPSGSRPFRSVDPNIAPCEVAGIRSIRWRVKGE